MNSNQPEFRLNDLGVEHNPLIPESSGNVFRFERNFIKALEDSIPSGIAVVDDNGEQVYVNKSFCKMFGWEESELIGQKPPFMYWTEDDIDNINSAFRQTIENDAPKGGFDLVFRNKKNERIYVNVNISTFKQNERTFYLANVIDITNRKKTEEELVRSRLFLMSNLESQQGIIIFSTDRNYHYLYFNNAHAEAMKFAYDADIKPGGNFVNYVSSRDDKILIKKHLDISLTGQSISFIQTFGKTNKAYYECFVNPIINDHSDIIGSTVLARNITERIQAEQARNESETKFREIIEQINDAITVFDQNGKIIIWNNGAERIYGIKSEDALAKNIIDVQLQVMPAPNNKKEIIEKVVNGILTLETPEIFNQIIDSEIVPLNSDNQKHVQSMVFPVKMDEIYLFCSVVRDVTEMKRYEKELLRISREKDQFYSTIAQYLYTPFNVFNNFSKLMAEELDNLPIKEIQKMARMMSNSASNLYGLLDNLLQWTKMNQGKISFEPQLVSLKKTCLESVSVLKLGHTLDEYNINFFVGDDLVALADKYMLKTIFTNLLSYVVKHSKPNSVIDIIANQTKSDIEISIMNDTLDLNYKSINEIFTNASIASNRGGTEEEGTTLSLLLCRDFVDKHGGRIWAESQKGNCNEIKFTLPFNK